ncbi:toxin-like protein 14 [Trichonephila inaurata madagascariensis]|uniref:Toxin-like protein 14 n=1 Tax=Trichonephila inaurata madagascariensis TaxID=2747483 RepID=A0A8X6Y5C7_9ARAC|nr:toxin-like protein 14 [Trichonephila inaurata madagascariensis]
MVSSDVSCRASSGSVSPGRLGSCLGRDRWALGSKMAAMKWKGRRQYECIDEKGEKHAIGEMWNDNPKCEEMQCIPIDGTLYIEGYGCGKIHPPKPCTVEPGRGIRYPDCCPQINCPNGAIW